MGCQTEVTLGDDLTFNITTHNPNTGVITDADASPSYRVYESAVGTAILSGSMAKLDDANTVGLYSKLIACTAANGFENNKSYTVYITATVGGDTGGVSFGFLARTVGADVWAHGTRTLTQTAAAVATTIEGSVITIHRGDSLSVSFSALGDISARSKLWFTVKAGTADTDTESVIQIEESAGLIYLNGADASARFANGSITVTDAVIGNITVALDEVETDDLAIAASLLYDVQMLTGAGVVTTLTANFARVIADVTRAVA